MLTSSTRIASAPCPLLKTCELMILPRESNRSMAMRLQGSSHDNSLWLFQYNYSCIFNSLKPKGFVDMYDAKSWCHYFKIYNLNACANFAWLLFTIWSAEKTAIAVLSH